jgi:hypothetical protein
VSTRERPLVVQVCARIDDQTLTELDAYMREREREARMPLSRSLAVREILETWAIDRVSTRSTLSTASTAQTRKTK